MKINGFVQDSKIFDQIKPLNNTATTESNKNDFLSMLKEKLDGVNDSQITADNVTQSFIKGDETDIHKVMLSTEEAKMSLELAVQIRNKLVEAYQELTRMQL
jgi:flagellar hook-basal body complex protein FliE